MVFLIGPAQASAVSPSDLTLLGQGEIHYLGFIKVYEASLYGARDISRETFFADQTSRCLKLDYKVELSADNFIEAAESVLEKQHDKQRLASVRSHIDQLHNNYQEVRQGDNYTLCYDKTSEETSLSLNGKNLVNITSPEFADIYFGIWLDETAPLSKALRDKLISGLNTEENKR